MSRKEQEEKNLEVLQLDPKKRLADAKRGGQKVLADPIATLVQPCETCGRQIGVDDLDPELYERLLAVLRERAAPRTGSGASLIPSRYYDAVAGARKDLAEATGGKDGDYENDFRMAEVPKLLPKDPRLLCYPPFADMFVHYLYQGKPAEVRKTLLALHRQALRRHASGLRALQIFWKMRTGKPITEIARDAKLSVSMVKKRLSEARRLYGPASLWGPVRRRTTKNREKT